MTPKYAISTAKHYHKSCLLHLKDYSSLVINCFFIFLQVYFAVVLLMTFDLLTCVHSQSMFRQSPEGFNQSDNFCCKT